MRRYDIFTGRNWDQQFRPAGRPPVKGGRWSIRKVGYDSQRPWRSWTRGKGQRFSRRFPTHAEAIQHATMVAQMFADPTPDRVEATIRAIYPNITEERLAHNVNHYAKFPKPRSGGVTEPSPSC